MNVASLLTDSGPRRSGPPPHAPQQIVQQQPPPPQEYAPPHPPQPAQSTAYSFQPFEQPQGFHRAPYPPPQQAYYPHNEYQQQPQQQPQRHHQVHPPQRTHVQLPPPPTNPLPHAYAAPPRAKQQQQPPPQRRSIDGNGRTGTGTVPEPLPLDPAAVKRKRGFEHDRYHPQQQQQPQPPPPPAPQSYYGHPPYGQYPPQGYYAPQPAPPAPLPPAPVQQPPPPPAPHHHHHGHHHHHPHRHHHHHHPQHHHVPPPAPSPSEEVINATTALLASFADALKPAALGKLRNLGTYVYPNLPFPVNLEGEDEFVLCTVLVPCAHLFGDVPTRGDPEFKLWGSQSYGGYTDDSDLRLIILHSGHISPDEMSLAKNTHQDLRLSLKVGRYPRNRYVGGPSEGPSHVGKKEKRRAKEGIRSGSWGNSHDGGSIEVVSVETIKKGTAHGRHVPNRKARLAQYAKHRSLLGLAPTGPAPTSPGSESDKTLVSEDFSPVMSIKLGWGASSKDEEGRSTTPTKSGVENVFDMDSDKVVSKEVEPAVLASAPAVQVESG